MVILYVFLMAIVNRCRGSQFYDHTHSTTLGRLLSCVLFGFLTGIYALVAGVPHTLLIVPFVGVSMFFWEVFAWDNYWSAAIGSPINVAKPTFWPVDMVMKLFPMPKSNFQLRLWGAGAMGLRQSLDAVCLGGLAWLSGDLGRGVWALGLPVTGFLYMVAGYVIPTSKDPIPAAEYLVGAYLGLLSALAMGVL